MIGNDVIDIAQSRTDSNWQRKGFIERLFTDTEQATINSHDNPEIMIWVLWSMKEAAYKIYNRETDLRAFIPLRLICSNITENKSGFTGRVECAGKTYFTETYFNGKMIHTVALTTKNGFDNIKELPGHKVFKNSKGHPFAYIPGYTLPQPVSRSHHGKYQKSVIHPQYKKYTV